MTGGNVAAAVILAAAITPNRSEGREWAVRELSSDPQYRESDLTFFERLWQGIRDFFTAVLRPVTEANSPWLLIVIGVVIAVLIALIVWRIRRGSGSALDPLMFATADFDQGMDPQVLRVRAQQAASAGDFTLAVQDQVRAIMAQLARDHVIAITASSTARELAAHAAARRPAFADRLHDASALFDAVAFGGTAADRDDYAQLHDLDSALSSVRQGRETAETQLSSREASLAAAGSGERE